MAGATAALLGGAVLSGIGGASSARAQKKAADRAAAAAKYTPWNILGGGGQVTARDGTLRVSDDDMSRMFRNMFGSQAADMLSGGGYGTATRGFAESAGGFDLANTFNAQDIWSNPASALAAGNLFSQYSLGNAGLGSQGGQAALANLFGTGQFGANEGMASNLFGRGLGALDSADFSQLAADQVARQRAFARPSEERAVNAKFQNLFNRGVLSSTSGERQLGELALGQELADIQRVNSAEQFANLLREQNRTFGGNLIGQGMGFRGLDQQFNTGMAGMFANTGLGLLGFGQGAGQSAFNTQFGLNELINTRGSQRLARAQGLLGFGSALNTQNLNEALGLFGGLRGINADQRALLGLSSGAGAESAMAGARQGNFMMQGGFSPFGSLLGGFGGGLMTGALKGAFGEFGE